MLVIKLKNLVDEIKAMKDEDFKKHVNEDKNDFADWIRNAIKNDEWADIADQILTKEDYIRFLELLEEGKEKTFKVTTPRKKPYSSRKKNGEKGEENLDKEDSQSEEGKKEDEEQSNDKQDVNRFQEGKTSDNVENWQLKLTSLKTPDEKIELLKKVLEKKPDDVNVLFALAAQYHRKGDYENAEKYYSKIIEKEPTNTKVMYYLASVYNSLKEYDKSIELYNKILSINPNYPNVKERLEAIKKIKTQQNN